jgi:hypothetical protein
MKKIVRLTESDLIRIVKRVIKENEGLLNQILDKINTSGINSLTSNEKEFLDKYSKGERPSSIDPEEPDMRKGNIPVSHMDDDDLVDYMGQDVNEYEDTYKHETLSEIILKMLDQYGNGELLGMDVSAVGKEFVNLIKNHLNTINVDKDSDLYNNIKEHVFNYFKKNFEEQLNVLGYKINRNSLKLEDGD